MATRKTPKTSEKIDDVCMPPEYVVLRHPALGTGAISILLRVPAYSESDNGVGYLPYELLWLAGVVFSNNHTDGYLTRSTKPNESEVDAGSPLIPGDYYFHVGRRDATEPEHYPLLRGMQQWKLLDEIIPAAWKDAATWRRREPGHLSHACILSGADEKAELAHLVPAALHRWFLEQSILQYAHNTQAARGMETRNASNMVRLQAPLHAMLDDGSWTLFPLPDPEVPGTWRFYSTWLRRSDIMANWYHGRPVRGGCEQVTAHTLFARFAYNIFQRMQTDHFGLGVERYLFDDEGQASMTSPAQIDDWLQQHRGSTDPKRRSKSKSGSPTKRSRSDVQDTAAADFDEDAWRLGKASTMSLETLDSGVGLTSSWEEDGVDDEDEYEGSCSEDKEDSDDSDEGYNGCPEERKGRFERLEARPGLGADEEMQPKRSCADSTESKKPIDSVEKSKNFERSQVRGRARTISPQIQTTMTDETAAMDAGRSRKRRRKKSE